MLAITDQPVPMHSEAFRELAATPRAQEVALSGRRVSPRRGRLLGDQALVARRGGSSAQGTDEPRRGQVAHPADADARHPGAPLRGDPVPLRAGGRRRGPLRCRRPAEREPAPGARRERCQRRAVHDNETDARGSRTSRRGSGFGVPFRWFVGPTRRARRPRLTARTAGVPKLSDTPGMALDFATMNDKPTAVGGLEVREVADAADFEAWSAMLRRFVPVRPGRRRAWRRATSRSGSGTTAPSTTTLPGSRGRPVAVSAILYGRETAGSGTSARWPMFAAAASAARRRSGAARRT